MFSSILRREIGDGDLENQFAEITESNVRKARRQLSTASFNSIIKCFGVCDHFHAVYTRDGMLRYYDIYSETVLWETDLALAINYEVDAIKLDATGLVVVITQTSNHDLPNISYIYYDGMLCGQMSYHHPSFNPKHDLHVRHGRIFTLLHYHNRSEFLEIDHRGSAVRTIPLKRITTRKTCCDDIKYSVVFRDDALNTTLFSFNFMLNEPIIRVLTQYEITLRGLVSHENAICFLYRDRDLTKNYLTFFDCYTGCSRTIPLNTHNILENTTNIVMNEKYVVFTYIAEIGSDRYGKLFCVNRATGEIRELMLRDVEGFSYSIDFHLSLFNETLVVCNDQLTDRRALAYLMLTTFDLNNLKVVNVRYHDKDLFLGYHMKQQPFACTGKQFYLFSNFGVAPKVVRENFASLFPNKLG